MAEENKKRVDELGESFTSLSEVLGDLQGVMNRLIKGVAEQNETLKALNTTTVEAATAAGDYQKKNSGLNDELSRSNEEVKKLSESQTKAAKGLGGLTVETQEYAKSSKKSADETEELRKRMNAYLKAIDPVGHAKRELNETLKEFVKQYPKTTRVIKSLTRTFSLLGSVVRGVFGVLGSFVKMLGSLALVIIRLPFRLFSEFEKLMTQVIENNIKLEQSAQQTAREFGSSTEGLGGIVSQLSNDVQGANRVFAQFGVTAVGTSGQVNTAFGNLIDGQIAFTRFNEETMKAMGSLADRFSQQIRQSGVAIGAFVKGLQLSGEQLQSLATTTQVVGTTIVEELTEINHMSQNAGRLFGVNARGIAQDVVTMRGDFVRFGQMSTQSLVNTSTHLRRMGLEIKDVVGLIDQFDDFEKAADSAAMLAQAFGMNIDAMELFSAQDPNERLDVLRRGFAATGRSIQDLNRNELRLLATQTNMGEEALLRAFSQEGLAMSYDELTASQEEAGNEAVTVQESMQNLADTLRDVFNQPADSFFAAFSRGMSNAVTHSPALQSLGRNISEIRQSIERFAFSFTTNILNSPAFGSFAAMLERVFNPERFTVFFNQITGHFDKFIDAFKRGDATALSNFFRDVIESVNRLFTDEATGTGLFGMNGGFFRTLFRNVWEAMRPQLQQLWVRDIEPFLRTKIWPRVTGLLKDLWHGKNDENGEVVTKGLKDLLWEGFWGLLTDLRFWQVVGTAFVATMVAGWLWASAKAAVIRTVAWGIGKLLTGAGVGAAAGAAGRAAGQTMAQGVAGGAAQAAAGAKVKAGFAAAGRLLMAAGRLAVGPVGAVLAAGAAGFAIGTWIDRTFIGPYREGMSRFRDEISQQSDENLEATREGLAWYEFNRRRTIDNLLAERAREREQTESILEPVRAAAEADRQILDRITDQDGRIVEELRQRRLNFERELTALNQERPLDRVERTWWGGMREVRATDEQRAAFERRVAELRNQYSDVAGQIDRGRELIAQRASETGTDLTAGIAEGMRRGNEGIGQAAVSGVNDALTLVQQDMQIRSPSERTAQEIGVPLVQGIIEGIRRFDLSALRTFVAEQVMPVLGAIPSSVGEMFSGFSEFERMGDILARPFTSVLDGRIFRVITDRFSRGVSGVAEGVQTIFTERFNQVLVANVERITREYNDLDSVLARGLPTVRLAGTLDRFNQAINVARETISVEQRPININVELHVTLDAEELSYALSDPMISRPLMPQG
jgi:uncharacterized protein YoxC